jgi:hypothetical protein
VIITNHVLSGAVVGLLAPSVPAAVAAGVASHFLLDAVPHFGVDDEHFMALAVPDGLMGLATIAVLATRAPRDRRVRMLAGVFGACLPDMDKPGRQFFGRSPFPAAVDRWHAGIQSESVRRFPVEVSAAALSVLALVRLLRPTAFPA